jgi:phage tail sheath protein FI
MPEYLAPGVFVEEVSFRSKSIEGVPTSTTGFAGMARYGPVCYPDGPRTCEPRLITSFVELERVYGGLDPLVTGADEAGAGERLPYLAHAARAFFDNGGKRLYVSRVFAPRESAPDVFDDWGLASLAIPVQGTTATWRARWPGRAGNVHVATEVVRTKNIAFVDPDGVVQTPRAKAGMVVEVIAAGAEIPDGNDDLTLADLRVVEVALDGTRRFIRSDGADAPPAVGDVVQIVEMTVVVTVDDERVDRYTELAASPLQKRYVTRILERDDPEDEDAVVWLEFDDTAVDPPAGFAAAQLLFDLRSGSGRLEGGHDGDTASPDDQAGHESDPDDPERKATGLAALGEIDDVAIVALPDGGTYDDEVLCRQAAERLIGHAERLRYRIAVVDAPRGSSLNQVRDFRGQFDSKYSALYHPWSEILDPSERPAQGAPPRRLMLPPSGFVTGIYARNDVTRGVHKAPANEVVRGLTRFEANVNTPRNEVLNPEGINALRFFEGRGHRVWGARTMSSDPEWKYVNVRRLFIFVEHSIDKGTQWAVFEPNNRRLWDNVRRTVEDFLLNLWKDGALLGDKPELAYFVRCDRTTMTQNDLDNGRLICLIGMAPVKPAEFVIFRIGQWTADAQG